MTTTESTRADLALQHRPGFLADSSAYLGVNPQTAEAYADTGAEDEDAEADASAKRLALEALAGVLLGFVAFVAVVGFLIVATGVLK